MLLCLLLEWYSLHDMHTPSVSSKTNGKATSETGQLLQRQLRAGLIPLAGNIAAVDLSLYATL